MKAAGLFRLRVDEFRSAMEGQCFGYPNIPLLGVESGKSYITKTISLKYTDFDLHLKRLGIFAGLSDGVCFCDLRRGAASAIDNLEVACHGQSRQGRSLCHVTTGSLVLGAVLCLSGDA